MNENTKRELRDGILGSALLIAIAILVGIVILYI
jgi:hypothetical protein